MKLIKTTSHVLAAMMLLQLVAIATSREFYFSWSADEKMIQRNGEIIAVNPPPMHGYYDTVQDDE